jgi:hypothetical protein
MVERLASWAVCRAHALLKTKELGTSVKFKYVVSTARSSAEERWMRRFLVTAVITSLNCNDTGSIVASVRTRDE